jgi:predicted deacylase
VTQSNLTVADITSEPGSFARGRIVVGYERDGNEIALPVLVMNGLLPGPTVYLGGLIHGDEPSGAEVIRRVMRESLDPSDLRGAVIAIPIQNPLAFRTSTYHSLEDGLNANRIFPGDATETMTNRCVAAITKYAVQQAQYVLDLHCNARDSILFNFVRWNDTPIGRESLELSKAFGFTTVISEAKRRGFGFEERLVGLLADMSMAEGKPTLTVELTPNYEWETRIIDAGVRGVLNVLRHLQMLSGELEPHVNLPIIDRVLGPQLRVTPERGGFVHPAVSPGDWVHGGDRLALIRDPWGDIVEEVLSPTDGYVLAFPRSGNHAAASGDIVVFVAPIHETLS